MGRVPGSKGCAHFATDPNLTCTYIAEPNSRYCRLHQDDESSGKFERAVLRAVADVDPEIITKPKKNTNPLEALSQFVEMITDFNDQAKKMMAKLNEDDWRYEDKAGGEQLRSEIAIYERSLDRGLRALQAVAKLNLAEKYLALSEKQAELMFVVLIETLNQLGVDGSDRRVQQIMLANIERLSNQSEHKLAELTK